MDEALFKEKVKLPKLEQEQAEVLPPPSCEEIVAPLFAKDLIDGGMFKMLVDQVSTSKNDLQQKITLETFVFDEKWIEEIEATLFSIEKIAKSPKSGLIEERLIVPVEKSKKVGSETVRHLSSHTSLIRGFDDEGQVRPSKVLNVLLEEDKAIYENRFVYSLIKKLVYFINTRIKTIRDKINTYNTSQVYHKSKFRLKKSEITYNLQVSIKKKNDSGVDVEHNNQLLEKIENLKKRLNILENTEFCKVLSKAKLVVPPIMKTNTIKGNVDYNNCYKLWLYISGYTDLGFFIDVKDKAVSIDTDYFDDLTLLTALSVKALIENDMIRDGVRKKTPFGDELKRFKVVDKIEYDTDKKVKENLDNETPINQYYFEQIKNMVKKYSGKNVLYREHKIMPEFTKFYKALTQINTKMFEDVLKLNETVEEVAKKTELAAKKSAVKKQKDIVTKQKKITSLMMTSVNQQLAKEQKETEKLKKAEAALEKYVLQEQKAKEKLLLEKAETDAKLKAKLDAEREKERAERAAIAAEKKAAKEAALKAKRDAEKAEKAILAAIEKEKRAAELKAQKAAEKAEKAAELKAAREAAKAEKAAQIKAAKEAENASKQEEAEQAKNADAAPVQNDAAKENSEKPENAVKPDAENEAAAANPENNGSEKTGSEKNERNDAEQDKANQAETSQLDEENNEKNEAEPLTNEPKDEESQNTLNKKAEESEKTENKEDAEPVKDENPKPQFNNERDFKRAQKEAKKADKIAKKDAVREEKAAQAAKIKTEKEAQKKAVADKRKAEIEAQRKAKEALLKAEKDALEEMRAADALDKKDNG